MIGKRTLGSPLREICTMGSERGDEYKRPCSLGEGTGSKEPDYTAAPQWATASRLVPTHQMDQFFGRPLSRLIVGRWPRSITETDDGESGWTPTLDVSETESEYLVRADLPA